MPSFTWNTGDIDATLKDSILDAVQKIPRLKLTKAETDIHKHVKWEPQMTVP